MIKRTIEISEEPAHISVHLDQLQIRREDGVVGSIPCEDIGVVVVDHPQSTYSHMALARLAEMDAAIVICGRNHLPVAMFLPMADHTEVVWRLHEQLAAGKPMQKQLWKQLIQAKIRAQASNLDSDCSARSKLFALARKVRSGDPANVEAHAARVYWAHWLPEESQFRRDADGDGVNALLNYGYAIMRAAVARAIVVAGLLPALGIKHSNRSNSFALADDLIEPLRPMVDNRVRRLYNRQNIELNRDSKTELLRLLADEVKFENEGGPLMVCLHRYVASFTKCLRGEARDMSFPTATPASLAAKTADEDSDW